MLFSHGAGCVLFCFCWGGGTVAQHDMVEMARFGGVRYTPDTPCLPYMPTLTPQTTPTDRHIWQSHGVFGYVFQFRLIPWATTLPYTNPGPICGWQMAQPLWPRLGGPLDLCNNQVVFTPLPITSMDDFREPLPITVQSLPNLCPVPITSCSEIVYLFHFCL